MNRHEIRLVETAPLPYLLSLPGQAASAAGTWPLLCFLHGHDEGRPTPIRQGLLRHGPLAESSAPVAAAEFLVLAPQLPAQGDLWPQYAESVAALVRQVQADHGADPQRSYLTGFSFGGNGVFDLALAQPGVWAALWAVDPTRVPLANPGVPVWLSSGEVSRYRARAFIRCLGLEQLGDAAPRDRVYEDRGQDHVGTARLAYSDDRIYRWLLSQQRSSAGDGPRASFS